MGSGLFDDYPKLKIILGHLGEGLPCSIWRIDFRIARHTGMTSTATKGIKSPVSRTYQFGTVFALLRGSFPSGNNNTVIVLSHSEKLDNLKFKLL